LCGISPMANPFVIYRAAKKCIFSGLRLDGGLHCNGQGRQDNLKLYRKGVELYGTGHRMAKSPSIGTDGTQQRISSDEFGAVYSVRTRSGAGRSCLNSMTKLSDVPSEAHDLVPVSLQLVRLKSAVQIQGK
jgi:hypothetical protein